MATIINLNEKGQDKAGELEIPKKLKTLLEERKKVKKDTLTTERLRNTPGLENLSDLEAAEAIDTIKKLAAIFFEIACQNEPTCIDNQQVVYLNQENKAA